MKKLILDLSMLPFSEANQQIINLCKEKIKISLEEINFILNLEEKELVETFLSEYSLFDQDDFQFIEHFTNLNLENDNTDFVSDLIYFASDFGLDLSYDKILKMVIKNKGDENCLVLSILEYLLMNFKFIYIGELFKTLIYVRDSKDYFQNEQILSSVILFKISNKSEYLNFVVELLESDKSNMEFFNNLMMRPIFNKNYFNSIDLSKLKN
ncbi:hypothetical protein [Chryseobacterium vrystaatense]|uniref:Uncharacterized protein n=1 Tax=Chryseobacterium vrystaatense TaxID=307480 RepID=A0A1M4ZDE4_9FLAO|nr:hypothetical protein [Chryseobacterium vrystaatense]SHF16050.1 hypothetical protein SAMN02787073_1564 [Chryseobacterium vrystaatense]